MPPAGRAARGTPGRGRARSWSATSPRVVARPATAAMRATMGSSSSRRPARSASRPAARARRGAPQAPRRAAGGPLPGAQPLGLVSVDGTLNVLKPVEVTGAATILLHAQGQGTNILIDATVTAGSGNINLRARGDGTLSPPALVTTDGQVIVDSQGQLPPGIEVVFTGQDEWTGQGPTDVTGGQLEGMDAQGNPIAAAISAILVDPVNPST